MSMGQKHLGIVLLAVLVAFTMLFSALAVMGSWTTTSLGPSSAPRGTGVRFDVRPVATCGQSAVVLGSASTYAALSATAVTSTGATQLTGDVGVSPGTSVTGFPPGTYTGTKNVANTASAAAAAAVTVAYNDAMGRTNCPVTVAGNIGGQTLTPGLYKSTSSLAISSGDLTLSGGGNPNGVFVFQVASALTTTSGRAVVLTNGAQAGNVFWQVGSSATVGTTSKMQGTILAYASITMLAGATLNGRALARTGDVTLSATTIVVPTTTVVATNTVTFTESGLAGGTGWSVTFAGVETTAYGATVDFTVADGTYLWSVGDTPTYSAMPATGSTHVLGAPVGVAVAFTAIPGTFKVTFTETGLASGMTWSVTLNGVQKSSPSDTIVFGATNGTTQYTVGDATGYTSSPSSGSVTVAGGTVGKSIAFTNSSGLPGTPGGGGGSHGSTTWLFSTWGWTLIALVILAAIALIVAGVALSRRRK
jgi:type VI secretion system secreted protein VgrG